MKQARKIFVVIFFGWLFFLSCSKFSLDYSLIKSSNSPRYQPRNYFETQQYRDSLLLKERILGNSEMIIEHKQNVIINWTNDYVQADIEVKIENKNILNRQIDFLIATQEAILIAQRRLMESIKEIYLTPGDRFEDFLSRKNFLEVELSSLINKAKPVVERQENSLRLSLKIYFKEVFKIVFKDLYEEKILNQVRNVYKKEIKWEEKDSLHNNIIILNLKTNDFSLSLFPQIVNEKREILLDYFDLYLVTEKFPVFLINKQVENLRMIRRKYLVLDVISAEKGLIVIDSKNSSNVNFDELKQRLKKDNVYLIFFVKQI